MPVQLPFSGGLNTYTKEEIDNLIEAGISTATGTSGTSSLTDSQQWGFKGRVPTTGYPLRDPLFDLPYWYVMPFIGQVFALSVRLAATTAGRTGLKQRGLVFELASANANNWSDGDSLLTKIGFYTAGGDAGKMKIEIGTEADFTGTSQDEWKSTEAILDATLQTEFTNGTLHIDAVGRTLFRYAG